MLYLRKYRILVVDSGGVALDVSELRCTLQIEKSVEEDPNYSEVVIYNLSEDLLNAILEDGANVTVEAGYVEGPYGLIFSGRIIQTFRGKEDGVDVKLTLVCQDGDAFLNNSIIAQTLSAGAGQQEVIEACAGNGTVSAQLGQISDDLSGQKLARGKVLFGQTSSFLRKAARSEQAQFYMEDEKIQIVKAGDIQQSEAVELNPSTGLIGTPSQTEDGISAQALLIPTIRLNSLVHIDPSLIEQMVVSKDAEKTPVLSQTGLYRVVSLTYEGDTRGDSWYVNFDAVSQPGSIPSLLKEGATNPWR